jgi:hypothetical protein
MYYSSSLSFILTLRLSGTELTKKKNCPLAVSLPEESTAHGIKIIFETDGIILLRNHMSVETLVEKPLPKRKSFEIPGQSQIADAHDRDSDHWRLILYLLVL